MADGYEMHVIPNTHWDREWLYDYQETRMQLVELMDNLLEILEKNPEYRSFLMDSQTVPIEDYLEVRPENSERIRAQVSSGRLMVGPWYTCPEEFNVNGESLVRNLLVGHRVARELGGVMKAGYSPFSYGQNSQMAQIYAGFGIDTILFYHGVTLDEVPSEFILEGADGTRILGTRMGSFARYNFFFDVYRPAVYLKEKLEREYSWGEGGLPFHLCGPADHGGHYFFLDPVKHLDEGRLASGLENLKEKEVDACSTNVFAYMLGHDSYGPDERELELVEMAKDMVAPDRIFMSSLEDYLERLKSAVGDLEVLRGERRTPNMYGRAAYLYHEVTSSRTRMKRANARAENALQRQAEPLCAMAYALGHEYPRAILEHAWKHLLKCHPHDSIAGTGVDQIERDMNYRLDQVVNISRGASRRAMQNLQMMVDNSDVPGDVVILTVFNPLPFERSEVMTAYVDLPLEHGYEYFSIVDGDSGKRIPHQAFSAVESHPVLRQLNDATVEVPSEKIGLHFLAEGVPAMGYRTFLLRKDEEQARTPVSMVTGPTSMENEFLRVNVEPDGTLSVEEKESGARFDGLNSFVDDGEAGMAWRHIPPAQDRAVTSHGAPKDISLVESGQLVSSLRIDTRMRIPLCLDEAGSDEVRRLDGEGNTARRSSEEAEIEISSLVTLRKGARFVEVTTTFDNRCRDHRLRVAFPTGLNVEKCHAESAFDVVEREVERGAETPWVGGWNTSSPQQRFVDVSDGRRGLCILNEGLREYEVSEDPGRTVYVTLMRAYEIALSTVAWKWERHPEMELSQCPGKHEFTYAIMPHAGTWDGAKVHLEAERLNVPMAVAQVGKHGGSLPKSWGLMELVPGDLLLSCVKLAEGGEDLVVRVYNPTGRDVDGTLRLSVPVSRAARTDMEENPSGELEIDGGSIPVTLGPKKVETLKIGLGKSV